MFDCAQKLTEDSFKEVGVDANFSMTSSANDPKEKILWFAILQIKQPT